MTTRRSGRALVVGVSKYAGIADLPSAVRSDVEDIAAALTDPAVCGLDPAFVTTLLDADATAEALRRELRVLAACSRQEELLFLYFSGHGHRATIGGVERAWLLPHDADLAALDQSAVGAEELRQILSGVVSNRQVVMLDACHSGGIGSAKSIAREPGGFGKSGVDMLAAGAGRALLSSSRADERSLVLHGARNSVFTAALLEALLGAAIDRQDGQVGVLDVFEYVSRTVSAQVDQHPVLRVEDLESNFALARRLPPASSAKPKLETINELTTLLASLYPAGPTQDQIWSRAGGNVASLVLSGSGVGQWYAALAKAALGGGGVSLRQLLLAVAVDFPENAAVEASLSATS